MQPEPKCPYEQYKAMRASGPVVEVAPNTFAVTRYRDCKSVLLDWENFSAVVGGNNMFATFGPSSVQNEIDAILHEYSERPVLMRTDPPAHTRVRALVNQTLVPAKVAGMMPQIAALVEDLASPWIGTGRVEFVGEFASLLPNAVTTNLLGAAASMRPTLKFWAQEVMSRLDGPQSPERQLEVARNIASMARYFIEQIESRRANPTDDLISLLTHAQLKGDRLDNESIVNVIVTFLIGGHETTTFLLGNSLWRLARDPELQQQLRQNPEAVAPFIEEMLRLEPPTQSIMRTTNREVEIGGCRVPAGATLLVSVGSANRDEDVFEHPEECRVNRRVDLTTRHIAFGYGVHSCIGLNLARAEASTALQYLLPKMMSIQPGNDDPIEYVSNFMLRGPQRLDLSFIPA